MSLAERASMPFPDLKKKTVAEDQGVGEKSNRKHVQSAQSCKKKRGNTSSRCVAANAHSVSYDQVKSEASDGIGNEDDLPKQTNTNIARIPQRYRVWRRGDSERMEK
jgi:hypothetical protein